MDELKACPKIIYLQACDECYDANVDEITWCIDPLDHANLDAGEGHETIYDEERDEYADYPSDMAYVRLDHLIEAIKRIKGCMPNETQNDFDKGYHDGLLIALKKIYAEFPELDTK